MKHPQNLPGSRTKLFRPATLAELFAVYAQGK